MTKVEGSEGVHLSKTLAGEGGAGDAGLSASGTDASKVIGSGCRDSVWEIAWDSDGLAEELEGCWVGAGDR